MYMYIEYHGNIQWECVCICITIVGIYIMTSTWLIPRIPLKTPTVNLTYLGFVGTNTEVPFGGWMVRFMAG